MEEWRTIPTYEGSYEVSNLGRIRSLERITLCKNLKSRHTRGKILRACTQRNGYKFVNLKRPNGDYRSFRIHRLVALAFIPNPLNLPEINHLNEDKSDNRACNLQWVTHRENV